MLAQTVLRSWGVHVGVLSSEQLVLFVGAFGALAALLFGAPAAPLGQQKATIGGFALVVTLAIALHYTSEFCQWIIGYGLPTEAQTVLAPALGIAAMLFFGLPIHPPAAACVISYAQLRDARQQWPTFLIAPALVGCLYMLGVQLCVARVMRLINESSNSSAEAASTRAHVRESDRAKGSVGEIDML